MICEPFQSFPVLIAIFLKVFQCRASEVPDDNCCFWMVLSQVGCCTQLVGIQLEVITQSVVAQLLVGLFPMSVF